MFSGASKLTGYAAGIGTGAGGAVAPDMSWLGHNATGTAAWGQKTFRDSDDALGALAAIDAIEDGDDDTAPPFTFTMLPPTDAAAASLCNPLNQGASVYVWLAALDPVTMLLVPDPQLLGYYQWDIASLMPDAGKREVEVECVSAFDLLLEDDEGARLTDAFHESIWPGETGCANVTGLTEPRYWGMATPRNTGTVVTSGGGAGGGVQLKNFREL